MNCREKSLKRINLNKIIVYVTVNSLMNNMAEMEDEWTIHKPDRKLFK